MTRRTTLFLVSAFEVLLILLFVAWSLWAVIDFVSKG
jgi:hypothetical protein